MVRSLRARIQEDSSAPSPLERAKSWDTIKSTGSRATASGRSKLQRREESKVSVQQPGNGSDLPLELLGFGSGGIEELNEMLDDADSAVQWAIFKFEIGAGVFKRSKVVFLHINGWHAPAMKRGRANQFTKQVDEIICNPYLSNDAKSVSIEVGHKDEVNDETLIPRIIQKAGFTEDDLADISMKWAMRQYRKSVDEASDAVLALVRERSHSLLVESRSRICLPDVRDALNAVATGGEWNWAVVKSDPDDPLKLELVSCGEGGLPELQEFVSDNADESYVGSLRMDFGVGRLRRSKHVFLSILGENMPVLKRSTSVQSRKKMDQALEQFVTPCCNIEVTDADDLELDDIIEKVRRAVHIDDVHLGSDEVQAPMAITSASYMMALHNPQPSAEEEDNDQEMSMMDRPLSEQLELIHSDHNVNWALFGLAEVIKAPAQSRGTVIPQMVEQAENNDTFRESPEKRRQTLPAPRTSRTKLCQLCDKPYPGFGSICAPCRQNGPGGVVMQCSQCSSFAKCFGEVCEDCGARAAFAHIRATN